MVPAPVSSGWTIPAGVIGGAFTAFYGTGGPIYMIYLAWRLTTCTRICQRPAHRVMRAVWLLLIAGGVSLLWRGQAMSRGLAPAVLPT